MTATSPVPYPELWAKTGTDPNGATYGYPLYNHLDDTASIAEAVIDRWLGPKGSSPYTRLSKALGIAPEKALTFACLAHDIGKADPHFQAKVEELARNNPWYKPPVGPGAPHNIVSAQATQAFLDTYGATRGAKRGWATVLAGHHGMFPASADRPLKTNDYETWSNVRLTLLSHLCELHGIAESDIETMGLIEWRAGDITLMTSLLITCDWLASNEDAFPITAGPSVATGRERAREARHKLALGPAWAPAQQPLDKWQHRFGLEASARLHDSQQDVLDAARRMDASGGMLLIESATGSGKSAAALIAADIIAAKTKAAESSTPSRRRPPRTPRCPPWPHGWRSTPQEPLWAPLSPTVRQSSSKTPTTSTGSLTGPFRPTSGRSAGSHPSLRSPSRLSTKFSKRCSKRATPCCGKPPLSARSSS